jgi:hypothetical protein
MGADGVEGSIVSSRYDSWNDYPRRHENGKWLCRWCGKPLSGRRRSWCGKSCEEEVQIRCGSKVRRIVWKRDKGVCARCGLDTNALRRKLKAMPRSKRLEEAERLGLSEHELSKTLWEAHHTKAVKDGGGACGVDGLETLCLWCHKEESKKQRDTKSKKGLAKSRRTG